MSKKTQAEADAEVVGDYARGALRALRERHGRAVELWLARNETGSPLSYSYPASDARIAAVPLVCDDGSLILPEDRGIRRPDVKALPHGGYTRGPAGGHRPSEVLTIIDADSFAAGGPCSVEDASAAGEVQHDLDLAEAKKVEQEAVIGEMHRAIEAIRLRLVAAEGELENRIGAIAASRAKAASIYGDDWPAKLERGEAVRKTGLDPAQKTPRIAKRHEEKYRLRVMAEEAAAAKKSAEALADQDWRSRGFDGRPTRQGRIAGYTTEVINGRTVAVGVPVQGEEQPETTEPLTGDFAPTPRMEG